MKLDITHITRFTFRQPVSLNPHRLLLRPRGGNEISVLSFALECDPAARVEWGQDVFGNPVAHTQFDGLTDSLTIAVTISVENSADRWPILHIEPAAHRYPLVYSANDRRDLGALLIPQYPDDRGTLEKWARGFVMGETTDTLSLLKDMNSGMLDFVLYRTRDEEGTQAPLETLAKNSGSCRDIAALFIDCARHLGFGARAVTGYLLDPDAAPGTGSTHAWAEVYLPGAGWIAFDPTHQHVGGYGLVPTAVGRSNDQIMPVTGSFAGNAADFDAMTVEVTVQEV
jgi:transglutaminase-like putative cysteine protease